MAATRLALSLLLAAACVPQKAAAVGVREVLVAALAASPGIPGALGTIHLRWNDATGEVERVPVPSEMTRPSKQPLRFPKGVLPRYAVTAAHALQICLAL